MKKMKIAALALTLTTLIAPTAFAADVLNCWLTSFHPNTPFMTATIVKDGVLSDVRFNYRNSGLTAPAGEIVGQLITTNHSPYRGDVRYSIPGAGDLVLPGRLSNTNLQAVLAGGIGYNKGENGVLIGSLPDSEDDAGNHVSYRLSCESTRR